MSRFEYQGFDEIIEKALERVEGPTHREIMEFLRENNITFVPAGSSLSTSLYIEVANKDSVADMLTKRFGTPERRFSSGWFNLHGEDDPRASTHAYNAFYRIKSLSDLEHIPGTVILRDGRVLGSTEIFYEQSIEGY